MYVELAVALLFLVPIISPGRWHKIFKSRFLRSLGNMSHIYFKVFLGALALFFLDSIREMRKYSMELGEQQKGGHGYHLDAEMQAHMRLFRAQRNFYIAGFSLFLWIVLQRLMSLISRLAIAEAASEAALAQAKSASAAAQQFLDQDKKEKESSNDEAQQKMTNVANEIKELKEEKRRLEAERDAALKQAEGVKREYDRMLEEHAELQKEVKASAGGVESKKDD